MPLPDAPQDMLLQDPQVLEVDAFFAKFLPRLPEPLGKIAAQKRDDVKRENIDEDLIEYLPCTVKFWLRTSPRTL